MAPHGRCFPTRTSSLALAQVQDVGRLDAAGQAAAVARHLALRPVRHALALSPHLGVRLGLLLLLLLLALLLIALQVAPPRDLVHLQSIDTPVTPQTASMQRVCARRQRGEWCEPTSKVHGLTPGARLTVEASPAEFRAHSSM